MGWGLSLEGRRRVGYAGFGHVQYTTHSVYVGLVNTDIKYSSTTTLADMVAYELTTPGTNGYARQLYTPSDPGATRKTANVSTLTFGPFVGNLGTIWGAFLTDQQTGSAGEWLFAWLNTPTWEAVDGSSFWYPPGTLDIVVGLGEPQLTN